MRPRLAQIRKRDFVRYLRLFSRLSLSCMMPSRVNQCRHLQQDTCGTNRFAVRCTCRDCGKILFLHCLHELSEANRAKLSSLEERHIERGRDHQPPQEAPPGPTAGTTSEPEPEVPASPTRAASAPSVCRSSRGTAANATSSSHVTVVVSTTPSCTAMEQP